jgi:folate-dependent phosphoribosylglycinamide formyltransferase PurN
MKIAVFTSNMPRHLRFIERLSKIADTVYAVQECLTLFPGMIQDSVFKQSPLMTQYFEHVHAAEREVFGDIAFSLPNVRTMTMKMGDVSHVPMNLLSEVLNADYIVVFGAGFIKPPLIDALVERKAVNIHMGVSPYFRGSSCNFWAVHDGCPELVGATIHLLSRGLDSGDMLFHALPKPAAINPFLLGMKAVESAHIALCNHIKNGTLHQLPTVPQTRSDEIRYSRHNDFTDEIVESYLTAIPTPEQIGQQLTANQGRHKLLNPVYA